MNACSECAQRTAITTVRDKGTGGVDITLGLDGLGGQLFACPACGQRYERTEDTEVPFLFRDDDVYHFRKVEPVLTREEQRTFPRCPRCHSWDVTAEPLYELMRLVCRACGEDDFVDWTQCDEWDALEQDREAARQAARPKPLAAPPPVFAEVARLERPGCASCGGPDATVAWDSLHALQVASAVREVHFGVDVKRCGCGQPWVVVFAERVDYREGNDDQTWLAVPVTEAEVSVLTTCEPARVPGGVEQLGRGRRFLLRSNLLPAVTWRDSGFAIPPHG